MEDILPISLGIAVVVSLLKALYVEKEKRQKEAEAKAASEAEQEKGRERQVRLYREIQKAIPTLSALGAIPALDLSGYYRLLRENEHHFPPTGESDLLLECVRIQAFLTELNRVIESEKLTYMYLAELLKLVDFDRMGPILFWSDPIAHAKEQSHKSTSAAHKRWTTLHGKPPTQEVMNAARSQTDELIVAVEYTLHRTCARAPGSLEEKLKQTEYYHALAMAMVAFFVEGRKLDFNEIYHTFEKTGALNSHWEESVIGNLGQISSGIQTINAELKTLNAYFDRLVDTNETLVMGLESIESKTSTLIGITAISTAIQGLTAYKTWQIQKSLAEKSEE